MNNRSYFPGNRLDISYRLPSYRPSMSSDRNATLHRNDGSPGPSSRPLTTERNDGCPGPSSRPLTTKRDDGGPGPSSRPLTTKRNDGCPGPSSRPLTTKRNDGCPGPSSRPLTTKRNSGSARPSSRPLTIERPSKFQPSVYKGTTGQYFAEPAGDRSDYYWVTVWFHKDIDHRGIPDSTIMMSAQRKIENGDFTIEDQAMHGIGKKCLSIPIKRDPDTPMPKSHIYDPTHPDLLLARNLMDYWNDQIEARKVTLDQRMIFVDTRRKKVRLADMLDVGEVLMDPWRIL